MKVTKWSTFTGDLNVSEQKTEQTSAESGSSAGPNVPGSSQAENAPVTASVDAPDLVPGPGGTGETPKAPPEVEAPKADAPRSPGKLMIMSSADHGFDGNRAGPEPETESGSEMFGKRRVSALAAGVALAAMAGALGGALATASLGHLAGNNSAATKNSALEATVARIDADIANLRISVEHTSKMGMSQFNKTSDRLDKVEKALVEPALRLAKLSEAVDKLRAAPPVAATAAPVAAVPAAANDTTASIAPHAAASETVPKTEIARLPTVEGWVLRAAANGVALIENRRGMLEVYAGDSVPNLGRVDAIRRQDGRWVVVTSKGLIVAR
jgi:hypothetical protein